MIYDFDNPFVFWTKVNNHEEIKEYLMPHILNTPDEKVNYQDGSRTSYFHQQYNYFNKDVIEEIVWKPFEQMFQEKDLGEKPPQFRINSLWFNDYKPGGRTFTHKHNTADWSGIYLLHLEEPNTTVFYSAYGEAPNSTYMNKYKVMDMVPEGYVMLFPSFMLHAAGPCTKQRISIAFDIACDYHSNKPLVFY
jgi:hypothetical protein